MWHLVLYETRTNFVIKLISLKAYLLYQILSESTYLIKPGKKDKTDWSSLTYPRTYDVILCYIRPNLFLLLSPIVF